MMEIIPFRPEHWNQIEVRSEICKDELGLLQSGCQSEKIAERFPSLTILDGTRVVACFGGIFLCPFKASSWMRTFSDIFKYKKVLISSVNNLTDFCIDLWKLKRIETVIQADWIQARRFAEYLGYKFEFEMKKYVGSTTFCMYSKIIKQED